jgi:hypothetical protein
MLANRSSEARSVCCCGALRSVELHYGLMTFSGGSVLCRPALAPSRQRYSYGARCIPVLEAAEFFLLTSADYRILILQRFIV